MHRTVLAILIAFAVAVAPVGFALAAAQAMDKAATGKPTMDMAGMKDCHGKKVSGSDHSDKTGQDRSCCDDAMAKCSDACGINCCKLMGMVAVLPEVGPQAFALPDGIKKKKAPEWRLRPRPPPPRA